MDINVNIENARELVSRIRAGADIAEFKQSNAYEALAHLANQKNWDTLSGLLKAEQAARNERLLLAGTGFTAFVKAFSCDEYGESPDWARIRFSQKMTLRVLELMDLVKAQELEHVAISYGVDYWHNDKDLRISYEDLYVSRERVWFRGLPKHADYAVETRSFDFVNALNTVRSEQGNQWARMHKRFLVLDSSGDVGNFIEELEDAEAFDFRGDDANG